MKLTNENVAKLRERGWSFRKIATYFDKTPSTIFDRFMRYQKSSPPKTKK